MRMDGNHGQQENWVCTIDDHMKVKVSLSFHFQQQTGNDGYSGVKYAKNNDTNHVSSTPVNQIVVNVFGFFQKPYWGLSGIQ